MATENQGFCTVVPPTGTRRMHKQNWCRRSPREIDPKPDGYLFAPPAQFPSVCWMFCDLGNWDRGHVVSAIFRFQERATGKPEVRDRRPSVGAPDGAFGSAALGDTTSPFGKTLFHYKIFSESDLRFVHFVRQSIKHRNPQLWDGRDGSYRYSNLWKCRPRDRDTIPFPVPHAPKEHHSPENVQHILNFDGSQA
ncbi:hypothetical protein EVAR_86900_1 [Eumeta japonica]|uniref:Uncharacterized protein n=1 Tax=Eumeta variegata TaxID=151549 RepID=A0A4C1W5N5_EUMVA|nr:hypothetical protein EVAR_86900_1 [Eumeta japonica]